eukprot:Gb_23101 [translate_table: standard]
MYVNRSQGIGATMQGSTSSSSSSFLPKPNDWPGRSTFVESCLLKPDSCSGETSKVEVPDVSVWYCISMSAEPSGESSFRGLKMSSMKVARKPPVADSDSNSDNEDQDDAVLEDHGLIIWTSLEETTEKFGDIVVADRSFLHDDIVAAVSDPSGQTCTIVKVHLTIDLKTPGGEIKIYISRDDPERLMPISKNLLEDTQYPYHPGQRVQGSSSLVFKNLRWLRGESKTSRMEGTVSHCKKLRKRCVKCDEKFPKKEDVLEWALLVVNTKIKVDVLWQDDIKEMDHLKMTVAKIEVHRPNVLLVEKTVSRYAQEYLLAKEISLVLNIKKSLLEPIPRCIGAQIVPSLDNLTAPKVGHSFAAYHSVVETSFLADEGATLLELPFRSPITVALPDKQSSLDRAISTISGLNIPIPGHTDRGDMHVQNTENNGMPTLLNNPSNLIKGRSIPSFITVGIASYLSGSLSHGPFHTSSGIANLPQTTTSFNPFSARACPLRELGFKNKIFIQLLRVVMKRIEIEVWLEERIKLFSRKKDCLGSQVEHFQHLLCKCFEYEPSSQPDVVDLWRCLYVPLMIKPFAFDLSVASNSLIHGAPKRKDLADSQGTTLQRGENDLEVTQVARHGCGIPWNWSEIHHRQRQEGLETDKDALSLIASKHCKYDGVFKGTHGGKCGSTFLGATASKTLSEAEKQLQLSNDRTTWLTAALLQLAPDQSYMLPSSSTDTSFPQRAIALNCASARRK